MGKSFAIVVAKGCNGTAVIRPAPFSEKIREAVNKHLCAGFCGIVKKQLFSAQLDSP